MPPTLRIEMGLNPRDGSPDSSSVKVFVGDTKIGLITNIRFSAAMNEYTPQVEIDLIPEDLARKCTPQLQAEYDRNVRLLQPFMPGHSQPASFEPPRPVCPTAWERLSRDDD